MSIITKICGLSTQEAVDNAVMHGAGLLGFIFFSPSPRHVTPLQAASLTAHVPATIKKVAVTVDMAESELDALLTAFRPDYLQLHGKESPERVAAVKNRYQLPVIKALSVHSLEDLDKTIPYHDVADMLLFDAKPPKNATLPGGNGISFDWNILQGKQFPLPWFLSGGLTCQNLREAVKITGAKRVDVSSGVESSPGVKDLARIAEFLTITDSLP